MTQNNKLTKNNVLYSPPKKEILLLAETSRSFGRSIVRGVLQFVNIYKNWNVFHLERNIQEKFPDWFDHWKGDGIISRSGSTTLCKKLSKKGVPVVELMGDGKKFPAHVTINEEISGRMAADHFYQQGFSSFAFFSLGHNWWSQERCDSFVEALKRYHYQCDIAPMSKPETDASLPLIWMKGIETKIAHWLKHLLKPVAIFCPWDIHALYLMNICRQHEFVIPEEVSILGYGNNSDLCRWSNPPLSSIVPNGCEVGFQAASLLAKVLDGGHLPTTPITIPPTHIEVRKSTNFTAVKNPILIKALCFIRDNFFCNPSVNEISRELNVSRSTLHRLFVTELNCSVGEEITRQRMDWAKQILRETDLTIIEIAKQLCYTSPSSFIRTFNRLFGMTPSEFRTKFSPNR